MTERLSVIALGKASAVWDAVSQLVLYQGTYEDCLEFQQKASKQLELDVFALQESVGEW